MTKDLLSEKLEKGWIHAKMFFEVMAVNEDVVKKHLKEHIEKIRKMENLKIVSEKFSEIEEVEDPPEKFKEAYSQIADIEIVVSSLENLIYTVIFFGPSSIEILEPKEMKVGFDSAQAMANAVAELMHKYAAAGAGGIVINTKE